MIISAFLDIFNYFFNLIVGIFPSGSGFPQSVHTAAQYIGGYARSLDPILPFDTLYQIILLVIIVEVAILGFKTFKWIISHIPFLGGHG